MKFFHGAKQSGPYFEGWYLKHQSKDGRLIAMIPALHIDSAGHRSASLQIISDSGTWWLEYPETQFQASQDRFHVRLEQSCFDCQGITVDIHQDGLVLQGTVKYGPFTTLKSDIMGPFRLFAGMQCSHGVISMGHLLAGSLHFNGEVIDFTGGTGYIETDRGRSFPDTYLWTQCGWGEPGNDGLMFAAATIPLPIRGFTGCICAIIHDDREYRLATYRGAKIEEWSPSGAGIRQGKYRLEVELLRKHDQPLRAPINGGMERTIHESLCADVRYRFWHDKNLLFQHEDSCASYEYAVR